MILQNLKFDRLYQNAIKKSFLAKCIICPILDLKPQKNFFQQRFVWHGMHKDIANWVKSCTTYQKGKVLRHNKTPLQKFDLLSQKFSLVHMDIVGPMPPSNIYRYLFTAVDRFSRWFAATQIKEITAEATADALLNGWTQYYGVPETITTKRRCQFTNQVWKDLLYFLGTKQITTTSYHPQSNKIAEILRRRLKDALRLQQNPNNWSYILLLILLSSR